MILGFKHKEILLMKSNRIKYKKLSLILLSSAVLLMSGCSSQQDEVQRYAWPVATASPEDTVTHIFAQRFADEVPGVFTNAKTAKGFVEITPLKASHRTKVEACICENCRIVEFEY